MTKILVTGASGFIGKHLISQLNNTEYELYKVDSKSGDIAEESTWSSFPYTDLVIHLAGKTFVPDSWTDPTNFIKCNMFGTLGALNYCKKHHSRLILLSSYLYGNPKCLPILETADLETPNPYLLSKKLAEEICAFYSKSFNLKITILRPFNVYGPGQSLNFLIPSIINQINNENIIRVRDLEPRRDYVFVDDLISAILKVINNENSYGVFNIGSGESHSVAELIQIIQKVRGTKLPVYSYGERRQDEIMDTVADITKAKLILDWKPKWSLIDGLTQIMNEEESISN